MPEYFRLSRFFILFREVPAIKGDGGMAGEAVTGMGDRKADLRADFTGSFKSGVLSGDEC